MNFAGGTDATRTTAGHTAATNRLQARGIALAPDGRSVLVTDLSNRVLRVTLGGRITVVAGSGHAGFTGDGGPATRARLDEPSAVAEAANGAIAIADVGNNRVRVVDPSGIIHTVAGNGTRGYAADGTLGPNGALNLSLATVGLTWTPQGALVFPDTGNDVVRTLTSDGRLATLAGGGVPPALGDGGPALGAFINDPSAVAFRSPGSLLVTDPGNNRIREILANGTIRTVAGADHIVDAPECCFSGDGGPAVSAQLSIPSAAVPDDRGGFLISDTNNARLRRVDAAGLISSITGPVGAAGPDGAVPVPGGFLISQGSLEFVQTGPASLLAVSARKTGKRLIVRTSRAAKLRISLMRGRQTLGTRISGKRNGLRTITLPRRWQVRQGTRIRVLASVGSRRAAVIASGPA